jgi:hypothetical protein
MLPDEWGPPATDREKGTAQVLAGLNEPWRVLQVRTEAPTEVYWKLVKTEEDPDGHSNKEALGALSVETTQGSGVWTYEKVGRDGKGKAYHDWKFRLEYSLPPQILKPGQVVTLTVTGTAQSEHKRHPSKAWGAFHATGATLKWVRTVRGTQTLSRPGWIIGSVHRGSLDAPEGLAEYTLTMPKEGGPDRITIWSVAQNNRNIVSRYTYQKVNESAP